MDAYSRIITNKTVQNEKFSNRYPLGIFRK